MRKSNVSRWFLASLVLLASAFAAPARAENVFVEAATGTGVSADDLGSATELVRSSVTRVPSETLTESQDDATVTLRPHLIRLGDAVILSVAKVRDGKIENSSELKAERMDELDKVADRVTRAALSNVPAKATGQTDNITDQESHDGTQRRPARKGTYLGFGPAWLDNLNVSGVGVGIGAGICWSVESALLKIMFEGDFKNSAIFASAGIGGDYFFSKGDVAPFVGGEFGAGVAKSDDGGLSGEVNGGFALGWSAGVQFLRTSSVSLELAFHGSYLLRQTDLGTPEVYSLRVGLLF